MGQLCLTYAGMREKMVKTFKRHTTVGNAVLSPQKKLNLKKKKKELTKETMNHIPA